MYYKRLNVLSSIIYYALLLLQDCVVRQALIAKKTAPNEHKHRVKVIAREIVRAHHRNGVHTRVDGGNDGRDDAVAILEA